MKESTECCGAFFIDKSLFLLANKDSFSLNCHRIARIRMFNGTLSYFLKY